MKICCTSFRVEVKEQFGIQKGKMNLQSKIMCQQCNQRSTTAEDWQSYIPEYYNVNFKNKI